MLLVWLFLCVVPAVAQATNYAAFEFRTRTKSIGTGAVVIRANVLTLGKTGPADSTEQIKCNAFVDPIDVPFDNIIGALIHSDQYPANTPAVGTGFFFPTDAAVGDQKEIPGLPIGALLYAACSTADLASAATISGTRAFVSGGGFLRNLRPTINVIPVLSSTTAHQESTVSYIHLSLYVSSEMTNMLDDGITAYDQFSTLAGVTSASPFGNQVIQSVFCFLYATEYEPGYAASEYESATSVSFPVALAILDATNVLYPPSLNFAVTDISVVATAVEDTDVLVADSSGAGDQTYMDVVLTQRSKDNAGATLPAVFGNMAKVHAICFGYPNADGSSENFGITDSNKFQASLPSKPIISAFSVLARGDSSLSGTQGVLSVGTTDPAATGNPATAFNIVHPIQTFADMLDTMYTSFGATTFGGAAVRCSVWGATQSPSLAQVFTSVRSEYIPHQAAATKIVFKAAGGAGIYRLYCAARGYGLLFNAMDIMVGSTGANGMAWDQPVSSPKLRAGPYDTPGTGAIVTGRSLTSVQFEFAMLSDPSYYAMMQARDTNIAYDKGRVECNAYVPGITASSGSTHVCYSRGTVCHGIIFGLNEGIPYQIKCKIGADIDGDGVMDTTSPTPIESVLSDEFVIGKVVSSSLDYSLSAITVRFTINSVLEVGDSIIVTLPDFTGEDGSCKIQSSSGQFGDVSLWNSVESTLVFTAATRVFAGVSVTLTVVSSISPPWYPLTARSKSLFTIAANAGDHVIGPSTFGTVNSDIVIPSSKFNHASFSFFRFGFEPGAASSYQPFLEDTFAPDIFKGVLKFSASSDLVTSDKIVLTFPPLWLTENAVDDTFKWSTCYPIDCSTPASTAWDSTLGTLTVDLTKDLPANTPITLVVADDDKFNYPNIFPLDRDAAAPLTSETVAGWDANSITIKITDTNGVDKINQDTVTHRAASRFLTPRIFFSHPFAGQRSEISITFSFLNFLHTAVKVSLPNMQMAFFSREDEIVVSDAKVGGSRRIGMARFATAAGEFDPVTDELVLLISHGVAPEAGTSDVLSPTQGPRFSDDEPWVYPGDIVELRLSDSFKLPDNGISSGVLFALTASFGVGGASAIIYSTESKTTTMDYPLTSGFTGTQLLYPTADAQTSNQAGKSSSITIKFTLDVIIDVGSTVTVTLPGFTGAPYQHLLFDSGSSAAFSTGEWNPGNGVTPSVLTLTASEQVPIGGSTEVKIPNGFIRLPALGLLENDESLLIETSANSDPPVSILSSSRILSLAVYMIDSGAGSSKQPVPVSLNHPAQMSFNFIPTVLIPDTQTYGIDLRIFDFTASTLAGAGGYNSQTDHSWLSTVLFQDAGHAACDDFTDATPGECVDSVDSDIHYLFTADTSPGARLEIGRSTTGLLPKKYEFSIPFNTDLDDPKTGVQTFQNQVNFSPTALNPVDLSEITSITRVHVMASRQLFFRLGEPWWLAESKVEPSLFQFVSITIGFRPYRLIPTTSTITYILPGFLLTDVAGDDGEESTAKTFKYTFDTAAHDPGYEFSVFFSRDLTDKALAYKDVGKVPDLIVENGEISHNMFTDNVGETYLFPADGLCGNALGNCKAYLHRNILLHIDRLQLDNAGNTYAFRVGLKHAQPQIQAGFTAGVPDVDNGNVVGVIQSTPFEEPILIQPDMEHYDTVSTENEVYGAGGDPILHAFDGNSFMFYGDEDSVYNLISSPVVQINFRLRKFFAEDHSFPTSLTGFHHVNDDDEHFCKQVSFFSEFYVAFATGGTIHVNLTGVVTKNLPEDVKVSTFRVRTKHRYAWSMGTEHVGTRQTDIMMNFFPFKLSLLKSFAPRSEFYFVHFFDVLFPRALESMNRTSNGQHMLKQRSQLNIHGLLGQSILWNPKKERKALASQYTCDEKQIDLRYLTVRSGIPDANLFIEGNENDYRIKDDVMFGGSFKFNKFNV